MPNHARKLPALCFRIERINFDAIYSHQSAMRRQVEVRRGSFELRFKQQEKGHGN